MTSKLQLTIRDRAGERYVPVLLERTLIGSGDGEDLRLEGRGIAAHHASLFCVDDGLWLVDESDGALLTVNGARVPPGGAALLAGDEVRIGAEAVISLAPESAPDPLPRPSLAVLPEKRAALAPIVLVSLVLAGVGIYRAVGSAPSETRAAVSTPERVEPAPERDAAPRAAAVEPVLAAAQRRPYGDMGEQERLEFVDREARRIALMMGNRPYAFSDDVVRQIKYYVDGYARRAGNRSGRLWGEDLVTLYARATRYAPLITRAFNERGVPPVVGLYIVMIETEYHVCLTSPVGAKGLFQFMPATARTYGVDPDDRCDVERMAPAAAAYMQDRIAEFGPDSISVALAIAGYNRSPDSVRRDLGDVLGSENRERSFWTLVANSEKLDRAFQNENVKYVPKFFAAAIVGENPWAFGLPLRPLSTYTEEPKDVAAGGALAPADDRD